MQILKQFWKNLNVSHIFNIPTAITGIIGIYKLIKESKMFTKFKENRTHKSNEKIKLKYASINEFSTSNIHIIIKDMEMWNLKRQHKIRLKIQLLIFNNNVLPVQIYNLKFTTSIQQQTITEILEKEITLDNGLNILPQLEKYYEFDMDKDNFKDVYANSFQSVYPETRFYTERINSRIEFISIYNGIKTEIVFPQICNYLSIVTPIN